MKKILIICYAFPPNSGIGGRRWAKFSKYLNRMGHDIRIITFDDYKKNELRSAWCNDVWELKDHTIVLKSKYPRWLLTTPTNFLEKILYRLSLIYVKMFSDGNYYDRACLLGNDFLNEVKRNINEGYNNVIVTSAPFRLSYLVSSLKSKELDFNFIVDFRDPWTDNLTSYGFESIGDKRFSYEKKIESKVVERASLIYVVAEAMKNNYVENHGVDTGKIIVIPNGFDKEDVNFKPSNVKKKSVALIDVIFVGTFYKKARKYFEKLVAVLKSDKSLKDSFVFRFIGETPPDFKILSSGLEKNIIIQGELPLEKALSEISFCDCASVYLTDDITYSLSTKFLESLYQRKPIIVFSNKGYVSDFVVDNNLGFSVGYETMKEDLLGIRHSFLSGNWEYNYGFDIGSYDIENISRLIAGHCVEKTR